MITPEQRARMEANRQAAVRLRQSATKSSSARSTTGQKDALTVEQLSRMESNRRRAMQLRTHFDTDLSKPTSQQVSKSRNSLPKRELFRPTRSPEKTLTPEQKLRAENSRKRAVLLRTRKSNSASSDLVLVVDALSPEQKARIEANRKRAAELQWEARQREKRPQIERA